MVLKTKRVYILSLVLLVNLGIFLYYSDIFPKYYSHKIVHLETLLSCHKNNREITSTNRSNTLINIPFIGPFQYLKNYKNPCWRNNIRNTIECIPYFYISGFSKCGTTDLFRRIQLHPQVHHGKIKESHYFDTKIYMGTPFSTYTGYFTNDCYGIQQQSSHNSNGEKYHKMVFGESTPMYIWYDAGWTNDSRNEHCTEPQIISAHYLHHLIPQAKTIICLRNPTERLYSDYLFYYGSKRGKNVSNTIFHELVEQSVQMYTACFKQYRLRSCLYNTTLRNASQVRLVPGIYYVFLKDWLAVFPRKQVLLLSFKEYTQNLKTTLQKVYKYLQLDSLRDDDWKVILHLKTQNSNNKYDDAGPLLPETKMLLDSFYKPFNKLLFDFINDPHFTY